MHELLVLNKKHLSLIRLILSSYLITVFSLSHEQKKMDVSVSFAVAEKGYVTSMLLKPSYQFNGTKVRIAR
jgi:hypothetical protein